MADKENQEPLHSAIWELRSVSILAKKNEISEKYLGKGGVHGVGMSRQLGVIKLHVVAPEDEQQRRALQSMIENVRKDAAPYEILTDLDERATISQDGK